MDVGADGNSCHSNSGRDDESNTPEVYVPASQVKTFMDTLRGFTVSSRTSKVAAEAA